MSAAARVLAVARPFSPTSRGHAYKMLAALASDPEPYALHPQVGSAWRRPASVPQWFSTIRRSRLTTAAPQKACNKVFRWPR